MNEVVIFCKLSTRAYACVQTHTKQCKLSQSPMNGESTYVTSKEVNIPGSNLCPKEPIWILSNM